MLQSGVSSASAAPGAGGKAPGGERGSAARGRVREAKISSRLHHPPGSGTRSQGAGRCEPPRRNRSESREQSARRSRTETSRCPPIAPRPGLGAGPPEQSSPGQWRIGASETPGAGSSGIGLRGSPDRQPVPSLSRARPPKMSRNVQVIPVASPLRKKRVDFEDTPDSEASKPKRPRLGPVSGLTPCLQPLAQPPCAVDQDSRVLRIGPYILLEPREEGHSYRAVHTYTETEYSCKVYPARSYPETMAPYGHLSPHPNVAQVAEVIQGEQNVYIFFQPGRGDMHSHVRCRKRLPEREAAGLFRQMAEAVAHCHDHGVILRDLKLRKFLFVDRERTKLVLENLEDACLLSGPDDSLSDKHGCPAYVGPEILSSKNSYSGKAADVWSLGVVLYTMLVGRYPFQDTEPAMLFSKIRRGVFSIPDGLSPKARCLVRCLLRKTPSERLTAREILLHPWLASGGAASEDSCTNPSGEQGLEQVVPDTWSQEEEEEEEEEEDLHS
ncbi:LOW QUALITY PROTEIN: tribbles homolog 3 [Chelonia mydas]|uniref:LOW QUALITY PROTEIN: tribbles homolog 3 n=1 Tax=Chelonia mydas TaxID=8469 RepID=UPI001CA879B2|nr:LOW QUALITY PROTEIN: tribbles homolog 3 [Chelonia mydas]